MSITNISKPTTTLSNTSKAASGVTWATETHTWANDPYTWADKASNIRNAYILNSGLFFSSQRHPFLETSPFTTNGGITNIAKP